MTRRRPPSVRRCADSLRSPLGPDAVPRLECGAHVSILPAPPDCKRRYLLKTPTRTPSCALIGLHYTRTHVPRSSSERGAPLGESRRAKHQAQTSMDGALATWVTHAHIHSHTSAAAAGGRRLGGPTLSVPVCSQAQGFPISATGGMSRMALRQANERLGRRMAPWFHEPTPPS